MTHRDSRIFIGFALANLLLVLSAVMVMARGPYAEIRRTEAANRLAENRYALKEQNYYNLDENKRALESYELAEAENDRVLLSYGRLAEALAGVSDTARLYRLTELSFETGEPVVRETDADGGSQGVEISVSAAYEGDYADVSAFIQTLAEGEVYYHFTRLTLTPDTGEGVAGVKLNLSVFAVEEGY